jgi:hypothetical protein
MSLYKEYQKDMYDRNVLENEYGFISYKKYDDSSLYVHSFFVSKQYRQLGTARKLYKELLVLEKPSLVSAYIDLTTVDPELPLKVFLHEGFKIINANETSITIVKEIE